MTENERETLKHFFAACFHQDWPIEGTDSDVATFVSERRNQAELRELARLVESYALGAPDENWLADALLAELGCYYDPAATGQSTKAWMCHVADMLRAGAADGRE